MMQIDRYMYEHLKNWCDGDSPRYQKVMYVKWVLTLLRRSRQKRYNFFCE